MAQAKRRASRATAPTVSAARNDGIFAAGLAAGALLGLFSWWADWLGPEGAEGMVAAAGNGPGPWLALAFGLGAASGRMAWGAFSATAALAAAVAVYYGALEFSGDRAGIDLQPVLMAWLTVALIAGPVFGAAGGGWRSGTARLRPFAVALLAGAFAAEAAFLTGDVARYSTPSFDDAAIRWAAVDVVLAAVLPVVLLRRHAERAMAWVAMGVLGALTLGAMLTVVEVMRDRYNA